MEPSERQTLCFVSWNVQGVVTKISSKPKIFCIIEELSRQAAQIVFLQETYIGSRNYRKLLDNVDGWKCFFTVYDSKSKGVAILIRDDVQFEYICHDEDYSGGYLVLFCYLHDELFTLVNVYNHKHDREILNRLQEYLRETAEGVLVVGGDFNTVLDISFDQKSKTSDHEHTELSEMFDKFTASLNLMDTWAHLHPTDSAFTQSQKDSFSRLDMFLMPEDIIERVSNLKICKAEMIQESKGVTNIGNISEHQPVVLSFTLNKCSIKKIPEVASWLETYTYSVDERAGKINGAEILSVIKSLINSEQKYCDGISIQSYKMYRRQITEILKISFNHLLYCKQIPDCFKMYTCATGTRKIFNVDYLIFTTVLVKRLSMLLPCPEKIKQISRRNDCYIVTCEPVKIRWSFLKKILSYLYETYKTKEKIQACDFSIFEGLVHGASELTEDFSILDSILPPGDFRELQEGCPLTMSLLSLVLKYLEIHMINKGYIAHLCQIRQVLFVCKKRITQRSPEDQSCWGEFRENVFELRISKMERNPQFKSSNKTQHKSIDVPTNRRRYKRRERGKNKKERKLRIKCKESFVFTITI